MLSISAFILISVVILLSPVKAIPTISAAGSKFFTSDGKQFFIKGIAYQLTEDDPLVNTQQCELDAALMKQLGANTIRVYHVDADGDHQGCMNAFAAAGIYLFVDLDSFKTYIRYDTESSWTQDKSDSYRAIMDNFQQFDNTAGFFVGNEVLNVVSDASAAPYLLSAAADLKGYRDAKGYRKIPIGYSATDTAVLRPMLQSYLVCRANETERLDFYALNSYEWCGASATYQTSGYTQLQAAAADYPVPIFFSEDGCNTVPPRDFADQAAIFGPEMVDTWSGAIIYEWIEEMNNYGLISYGPKVGDDVIQGSSVIEGFTRQGTPTPVQPDFSNLQAQWATATPTGVVSSAYVAKLSVTVPDCPASTAGGWAIDPSAPLPTVGNAGVSKGIPTGVPSGSITVMETSSTYSTTASSTATSSARASSTTSKSAASKGPANPLSVNESGIISMLVALTAVGAGVTLLL